MDFTAGRDGDCIPAIQFLTEGIVLHYKRKLSKILDDTTAGNTLLFSGALFLQGTDLGPSDGYDVAELGDGSLDLLQVVEIPDIHGNFDDSRVVLHHLDPGI